MPEHTIAENLARLTAARTAIAGAITAKGGTVAVGDGLEDFPTDIETIPSGGSSVSADNVTFYDYDGTVVASYTAAEFAELSAMPSNPSHEGLTAQGWNWSLVDAKAYVAKYGTLDVGQMYITDDGRTRLYVRMQEGRLSPILALYLNANSKLDIDWGDGTAHSTFASTSDNYVRKQHNYASAGDYVVSIGVTSGSFVLRSSLSSISTLFTAGKANMSSADIGYLNSIEKVEIGSDVISISTSAFQYCYSLSQVTIPEGVTSIGTSAFQSCYSVGYIKFESQTPPTVASISAWSNVPTDCKILVPRGTLAAYTSATNYPNSNTYTYEEYDV